MELLLKDFRTFLFARSRQFLEDFIDFLSGPKTFLASATAYTSENLARAFSFFVIVYILVNLLFVFLVPQDLGLEKLVVFNIVYTIVFLGLCLLLLQLSWLIVGARPPLRRMLLAFLYVAAVGVLIQMIFVVAWVMIAHPMPETVAAIDRLTALQASDPQAADAFLEAQPYLLVRLAALVGALAVYVLMDLVWFVVVWGAFRTLAGTGRIRSAGALVLFFTFSLLLFAVSLLFLQAFVPGLTPA
jgi:hypothetical protein